jgi:hypothetical protein
MKWPKSLCFYRIESITNQLKKYGKNTSRRGSNYRNKNGAEQSYCRVSACGQIYEIQQVTPSEPHNNTRNQLEIDHNRLSN